MTVSAHLSLPEIIAPAHALLAGDDRALEEAHLLCVEALRRDPENANATFTLARIALRLRRFDIALNLAENLLAAHVSSEYAVITTSRAVAC